jgi:hypothetical protein
MPSGLRRFQQSRQLHFITFSCYRRQAELAPPGACNVFENSLEHVEIESEWTAQRREQLGMLP